MSFFDDFRFPQEPDGGFPFVTAIATRNFAYYAAILKLKRVGLSTLAATHTFIDLLPRCQLL